MRVRLKHERLAQELARSPLTLNRWAQRMGLRSGHLSQLASGKRCHPTARTRERLLAALDLDFDELFEVETAPMSTSRSKADARAIGPARPQSDQAAKARFSDDGSPTPRRRPRQVQETPMSQLLFDLRHAVRALLRRPGFTAAAVATLALGIGANVALFSLVNATLVKAYPYDHPERLYQLFSSRLDRPGARYNFSFPDYLDFQERLDGLIDIAVWDWEPFSLAGGDRPQRVGAAQTTANFARVVGVDMLEGRYFTEQERLDGDPVLVIKESLWRTSFGSDPAIVGREVVLDGRAALVVGVAPAILDVVDNADLFVPLRTPSSPEYRNSHWLGAYGRIAAAAGPAQAAERLNVVAAQLADEYPEANEGRGAGMIDLVEARVGEIRPMILLLLGVVVMVLLIVCANVANLLLSRGASRAPELWLRAALGAGRTRLVRYLLAESALLALAGLGLGTVLGLLGASAMMKLIPAGELPAWIDPSPDPTVLLYSVLVSGLALCLFGAIPALRQSRTFAASRQQSGLGSQKGRGRASLVVAEVALSAIVLVGAGLMVKSLVRLTSVDSGLETSDALVLGLDLLSLRNEERPVREQRFLEYYRRFERIPGVGAVGAIDRLPLSGGQNTMSVTAESQTVEDAEPFGLVSRVTPGYLPAAGLAFFAGSDFEIALTMGEDGPLEVVVSRRFAESVWLNESPIGRRIKFGRPEDDVPWYQVRGVVGDVRHVDLADEPLPTIYFSDNSLSMSRAQWVIRGDGSSRTSEALIADLRAAVREIDPHQPLWGARSLEKHVFQALWSERFFTTIFWFFGALAMVLAGVGIYGVMAYRVAQRRYEMGVRLALGATRAQVASLIIGHSFRLVLLGTVIGLPGGLGVGKLLSGALFGVDAADPSVLLTVVAVVLGVGLLAAVLPARRAAILDPAATLRSE